MTLPNRQNTLRANKTIRFTRQKVWYDEAKPYVLQNNWFSIGYKSHLTGKPNRGKDNKKYTTHFHQDES